MATTVSGEPEGSLGYDDIPWPIAHAHWGKAEKHGGKERPLLMTGVEELTAEAISSFLLPPHVEKDDLSVKKEKKDRLREAFRRFHPDKFEGRFMGRVNENDKEKVREAIGQISRVLNLLMGE